MRLLLLSMVVLLSACTTTANFAYAPVVAPPPSGPPDIGTVTVSDTRAEHNPHYVGAIRGGFGNPVKTLISQQTVAEVARAAFEQALTKRGLFGPGGKDLLAVRVISFSANQYVGPDVHAGFAIELRDPSGHVLYTDSDDLREFEFKFFANGIFGSMDGLREAMQQTMTHAIDQVLDKPGFVAAIRAP